MARTVLGANFWSRAGGPRMWTRYDPAVVREELTVLAQNGCTATRSFCLWPDFVPEPGRLDEAVAARFDDFLAAHTEAGLVTLVTFVVGHMSGQNFDPPWRAGRDLYRDVGLVAEQARFAEELARRFARSPAIAGWIVSNEMPLYGGPAPTDVVTAWARLVVQGLRAGGARQPVSLGDGAWGVETTGRDNGYSLRALAPLVDFVGPHVYPMEDDGVRLLLSAAFACELAGSFDRPVVLEEFGVSSAFSSDEHAAGYYRQVLHSTLLAGARGWLAWNNTDLDGLAGEDPYRHHPFELGFGLTDGEGRPKPVLQELARFARLVGALEATGWRREPPGVALVVPEHVDTVLPFVAPEHRVDGRDGLFQAYVAAREADLPVGCVREREGLERGPSCFVVPSQKALTAPGLARLAELAAGGALVYLSAFGGATTDQRGPWLAGLDERFGVRHGLQHGLVDRIDGDRLVLELVAPLGELAAGTRLELAVGGSPSARSRVPLEPDGAEVVARDAAGRPALVRRRVGRGQLLLSAYPIEHLAARTPQVNPEPTALLYGALALEAGVVPPVRTRDLAVSVGTLVAGDTHLAIVANLTAQARDVDLVVAPGVRLVTAPFADPPSPTVHLGPLGVAVVAYDATAGPGPDREAGAPRGGEGRR